MSAQPKPNPQPTTEFYVVISDGRTPIGAIGPISARPNATLIAREFQRMVPGACVGISTARPKAGTSLVSEAGAFSRGGLTMMALLSRAKDVAARLRPKHEQTEDGDGGRRS